MRVARDLGPIVTCDLLITKAAERSPSGQLPFTTERRQGPAALKRVVWSVSRRARIQFPKFYEVLDLLLRKSNLALL